MLDIKDSTTWTVFATCDDCKAEGQTGSVVSPSNATGYLESMGWVFATLEVEHWRVRLAICPKCSESVPWLARIIDEHTPEAYRRRPKHKVDHGA